MQPLSPKGVSRMDKRLRALVSGRVQGVFFRAGAVEAARRHGVCGWVRNLSDGRVELTAQGPEQAVDALLAWARHGPPGATVTLIELRAEPLRSEEPAFRIL